MYFLPYFFFSTVRVGRFDYTPKAMETAKVGLAWTFFGPPKAWESTGRL